MRKIFDTCFCCIIRQVNSNVNPIQDGHFWGCSRIGGFWGPKICHTYPTMVKRGTIIPYLKEYPKNV